MKKKLIMKTVYCLVVYEYNAKYHAVVVPADTHIDALPIVNGPLICDSIGEPIKPRSVYICLTKQEARETAEAWNKEWRENGNNLFPTPRRYD